MLNVYGIKNCNTVKKSLDWLANNNIEFQFHDVKKNTLDVSLISSWAKKLPEPYTWENIVNKSGITWRQLEDNDKNIATDLTGAIGLILKKPSLMKRPIITRNDKVITIGFDEKLFENTPIDRLYRNFSEFMEIEEKYGVKSTFFFRTQYENGDYRDYHEDIKELVNGGWEIGLHTDPSSITDVEEIRKETLEAKKIYLERKWPIIDVTRRSIEETAATIIQKYHNYEKKVAKENICENRKVNEKIRELINICRKLSFTDTPDYNKYRAGI